MRELTPADYQLVFQDNKIGAAILEVLVAKFAGNPYVKGGLDAQRETDARAGARRPIDFIFQQLNRAAGYEPISDVQSDQPQE